MLKQLNFPWFNQVTPAGLFIAIVVLAMRIRHGFVLVVMKCFIHLLITDIALYVHYKI